MSKLDGLISIIDGIAKVVGTFKSSDFGADWTCDNCGANLNHQFGFVAGDTWTCKKCGYENDVSESNMSSTYLTDDGLEVIDYPDDDEDPEDY